MLKLKRAFLFLFLAVSALPALAQVDTSWVRKISYAKQEASPGAGRLLALDKEGNIYLGAQGTPGGATVGFVIAKYNSCGDTLWVEKFGYGGQLPSGGTAHALAVDDSGNVYATGERPIRTVKLKPSGDTAWVRAYVGPNPSYFNSDHMVDIAVDKNRNVIVTGSSLGATGSYDWVTIKYAPNGDTVWLRRYDSGLYADNDAARALAVDTAGNVYVTGTGLEDYLTVKYSPAGTVLWAKSYAGPGLSLDETNDLALDALGNVYVTGRSYGGPSGQDFATIKYTPNGDTLWVRRYTSPGDSFDVAKALEVDQAGNVYVTGQAASNLALLKYGASGNLLWARNYPLGNAASLALDQSGNAYVTGSIFAGGSNFAILTVKYNPNGDTVWSRQYLDPKTIYNSGSGNHVAVDTAGDVYVGGNAGYDPDVTLIKYSSDPPCPPHYSVNTPAGNGVYIQPYPGMGILFKHVSSPGITTVTLNSTGPAPPSSFTLLPTNPPVYYDIQTTATFSDSVYICIFYSDSAVVANEDSLRILHYNGSTWQDVTVYKNVSVNDICAGTTSLSPFALAIPGSSCAAIPGDVNGVGGITLTDIITLVNYYFDKDKPPCLGSAPGNCWQPDPVCRADVDGTPGTAITDIVYLVNYYFDKSRPASGCLGSDPGNCWTPVSSGTCCLPAP